MKNLISILIIILSIGVVSCSKDDDNNDPAGPDNSTIPTLITTAVSPLSATSVQAGGGISSDGGSVILAKGLCWDTDPDPTVSNNKTNEGGNSAAFVSVISGLSPNTTYYLKAYATNAKGTAYGNQLQFTTGNAGGPCPSGTSTVTDIDGNVYDVISIGNQCWMKENLKTSKYRNGDAIPTGLTDSQWTGTTDGAYAVYANNAANENIYGKLYNYYAVADPRGLCPVGFHVPSNKEWNDLTKFLDSGADTAFGANTYSAIAGGMMKSTGTIQSGNGLWIAPNTGATNSSDFSAHPAGFRNLFGGYDFLGIVTSFWGAEIGPGSQGLYYQLENPVATLTRISYSSKVGISVRCVRD